MAKISFSTLKLKVNDSVETIKIADKEVEILQYLPAEDKYSLIMITLQQSKENGIYNAFKKELFFNLNLVYMYTNLTFTDKQKEDYLKLYDILESNGIINAVIDAIPTDEYENLLEDLELVAADLTMYNNSFSGVANNLMESIPKNAETAKQMADSFNTEKEKYKNVIDFARSVGMKE